MKILYINSFKPDYLSDCLFHGFYNLLGPDFTHLHNYDIMYKSDNNDSILKKSYGKGFTIWNNLNINFNDNSDIENKIKYHYFDYIIYGSIYRVDDYLENVLLYYKKTEIAFVDGEDHTFIDDRHYDKNILYFKRELLDDISNLLPISFSIPKEKISNEITKKEKKLAHIDPLNRNTYIFDREQDYYNDYKISYYGLTQKKGGWDCMRHYEILANRCLPYFRDLENCPKKIMVNFPKSEILKSNELFHNFNEYSYSDILDKVFNYTIDNLTTVESSKYILNELIKKN